MIENYTRLTALAQKLSDILEEILHEHQKLEASAMASLEKAPPGKLHSFRKNGRTYYMQRTKHKGRYRYQYIPVKSKDTAVFLAEKSFGIAALKRLRSNIEQINRLKGSFCFDVAGSALSDIPDACSAMIGSRILPNKTFIASWLSEKYEQNPFNPGLRNIPTLRGDCVRSKGERDIANCLYSEGIPYRVDAKVIVKDGPPIYCDFIILNPVTLELFYWEHAGMLDSEAYQKTNYNRLAKYASIGILPGQNLIITGESSDKILSTQAICRTIEAYLH